MGRGIGMVEPWVSTNAISNPPTNVDPNTHLPHPRPPYKPMENAQYLGSAAQGLGFFHVDV
jgi:hypothetical protein